MSPYPTTVFGLVPLAICLVAAAFHFESVPTFVLDDVSPKTVQVQLFEWNWDSVADECQKFLGPAGYGFVQVSPPQEHVSGTQWWTSYQPVSYKIYSKRGNRVQFQQMVTQCHDAGVGVIADSILNHMTGMDSGTGVSGSTFTHYDYPGLYQYNDFHHCGVEPYDDIKNYTNRYELQNCQLVGLADLNTGSSYVQQSIVNYVNDLRTMGVDGFRLDAAKHIDTNEIATILASVMGNPYITQEVTYSGVGDVQPGEYTQNGDVQEFRYPATLSKAFSSGNISALQDLDSRGWVPGNKANVFVANHDTERSEGLDSLNISSPSNIYILATIFSLGYPYGHPSILSSYRFADKGEGAPNGGAGACSGNGGSGSWLCQHRFTPVSGMVGFRNNVGSSPVTNWVSPQSNQIAFGRGSLGYLAINNADTPWTSSFSTSLPNGIYCDVLSGSMSNGSCSGKNATVSDGSFNATIYPRNALALHTTAETTHTLKVGNLAGRHRWGGKYLFMTISLLFLLSPFRL